LFLIINGQRYVGSSIPPYKRFDEIKVSTLILVGEHDIPDVHACSGLFNACISGSHREVIPGCGHLIALEQPALFNEQVLEFLGK